jgi:hypothetical protein
MSIDESIGYRLGWNVVVPGLHLQTELFDSSGIGRGQCLRRLRDLRLVGADQGFFL